MLRRSLRMALIALMLLLPLFPGMGVCSAAPLVISGPDAPADGNQYLVTGGCGSYIWSITKGSIDSSGIVTVSGQCGIATVTVRDACGDTATKIVRMPIGTWQESTQNPKLTNPWDIVGVGTYYVSPTLRVSYVDSSLRSIGGCWGSGACFNCPSWGVMYQSGGFFLSYQYEYTQPTWVNTCDGVGQDVYHYYTYSVQEWRCSDESSCIDNDGDGHYAIAANCSGGDDPIDNDRTVYPGAPDICGDFKDNSGSGKVDQWCGNSCPANKPTLNVSTGSSTNIMSGNFFHSQTLFATSGVQLPISIDLNYASLNAYKGALGTGWHHSYELFLVVQSGKVFFRNGDGSITTYTLNATGTYDSPTGNYSTLAKNVDGTFTIKYRDGLKHNFGTDGRLTSIVDHYGNSLSFNYQNGDLTTITDSAQRQVILNYDTTVAPHRITDITDPAANKYYFDYDPATGLLSKVTNPVAPPQSGTIQGYWAYTYENGRLKTKTDPNNKVTTYFYQPDGRMSGSLDPEGNVDSGVVAGHARTLQYDATGKTNFTEKDGGVWTYVYDTHAGVLKQKIAPNPDGTAGGTITAYAYYTDGNLKAKTEPSGNGQHLTTFYAYDAYGNLTAETEPLDLTLSQYAGIDPDTVDTATFGTDTSPVKWAFTYEYGDYDRLTKSIDKRGPIELVTSYTFDTTTEPGVEIMKVTDQENHVTTYRYNTNNGTLKSVIDANGVATTYDYYANSLLFIVKDQNGVVTKVNLYDNNGNPKQLQKFDNTGKLIVTTDLEYDALNRLTTVTRTTTDTPPIVTLDKYDYDLGGNLTVYTDPETKQTTYGYNYLGQVTKIIDSDQKETRLSYGSTGCTSCGGGVDKLTEVLDAKQIANNWPGTTYFYDKLGRLEHETDPRGKTIRYTYYDNGLVKEKIDATNAGGEKILITYTYNNRGQLLNKRYPDYPDINGSDTAFTYDANGRLWTATNQHISYTFDWYKNGWLKKITDTTNNRPISYEYDNIGNIYRLEGPDGSSYFTVYNPRNQPYYLLTPAGIFSLGHDGLGRLSNVTGGAAVGMTTTYAYDGFDRVTRINGVISGSYGGTFTDFNYTYYPSGNRKTLTDAVIGNTFAYNYDNLYRLLSVTKNGVTGEAYTYDEVGNRQTGPTSATSYSYSQGNQLDSKTDSTYTYYDNGNLQTKVAGGYTYTFTYDPENRLTKVTKVLPPYAPTTSTYLYDPFGRRIKWNTVSRLYDGDNILYDYDSNNSVFRKYVHNPGTTDDPIAYYDSSRGTNYYFKDALGSVVSEVYQSGDYVQTYNNYSYISSFGGLPTKQRSETPYAFTGREFDQDTGLYYYRARHYDPSVGRFIQRDPVQFAGRDVNLYGYVQNNPINWTDPLGLATVRPTSPLDGCPAGTTCMDPGPPSRPADDPKNIFPFFPNYYPDTRIPSNALPPPDWLADKLKDLFPQKPDKKPSDKKPCFDNYH